MNALSAAHACHEVSEPSQVGSVRRAAGELARKAGLDATACGNAAIVASELATNVLRHAGSGMILLRLRDGGVEIVAIDRGEGIGDVARALADGYSTRGTLGTGLGAVQRLASDFDIYSSAAGTAVLACVGCKAVPDRPLAFGAVCVPLRGEPCCGDAWSMRESDGATLLLVVDGLGHGREAAAASAAALGAFDHVDGADPAAALARVDEAMRGTRGGAAAIAAIPHAQPALRYCGIGNIGARLQGPAGSRGLVSGNGIVGGARRSERAYDYPFAHPALLVMHSDGLQSRWSLEPYPGLQQRHPAVIAAVLYRDFARGRDDATVIVAALNAAQ